MNAQVTDPMEFKFPLADASGASESSGKSAKMAQSPAAPSSPANYDFLMRRASAVYEAQFEDAILSIGSAMTAVEFRDTVKSGIHLAFLSVKQSLVMLLDIESNVLAYYESNTSFETLTKDGVIWECVRRRTPEMSRSSIPEDDPIRSLMPNLQPLERDQVVIIRPIVEKKEHRVLALVVAVCDEPSVMVMERVHWLERNILVAASRVLKHMLAERERIRAESMLEVCGALIDLDTSILSLKIIKHLRQMLQSEMCLLLLFDEGTHELFCQVFGDTALDKEIRLPINSSSLYGRCYLTGEIVNIEDVSKDARFNPSTDIINGYEPSTMLCMPVIAGGGANIAVAVVCNKQGGKKYTDRDQDNMSFILRFSSSVLSNTLAFQRELTLKKQNQALLQVAGNLFSKLNDLDHLLAAIMNEARMLTKAEKCSLFLLDSETQELIATVFDSGPLEKPIRIKIGQGIAGYVAKMGRLVNIRDAYNHPMFFKEVDKTTGFVTRNILCFPIKDSTNAVVGVAELVNKVGANFFTKYDEELATTFSVYCGISLHQSKLYKKMIESQGRSDIATELMIYHMHVTEDEVDRLASAVVPPCTNYSQDFSQFTYYPLISPEGETVMAVMSMMDEMDLIKKWKIPRKTIARFVLMVKKGYRDPPYHNWSHAFSVAHFCYTLFKNCGGLSVLSNLEVLALFISCLCHDIDHRGTNNAFQVSSNSVLASLYSSEGSVMERHHFTQTLCILNTKGCNVFEHFSPANYKAILDQVQHIILATDIANHLRHMKQITEMSESGYNASNETHHKLMSSLLMTSCDLCAMCKSWDMAKMVAELIYSEFFSQGDLEKALGVTPSEMMDRDRAFIPEQQLSFIDNIAGPVYKVLSKLLPSADKSCEAIQSNRKKWVELQKEGRRTPDPEQQLS